MQQEQLWKPYGFINECFWFFYSFWMFFFFFYLENVFFFKEHAFESSQKYKEGKFIIELAHMIKDNGWDCERSESVG